jgi:hypothetical protein
MIQNWKTPTANIKTFKEWFSYQWEQNRGFQKVIEDIAIIITGGVLKLVGKGAKEAYSLFKNKLGTKTFENTIKFVKKQIQSKKSLIGNLPKSIKEWSSKKVSELEKGSGYLESAPKEVAKGVIKKIPRASIMGGITYAGMVALEFVFKKWTEPKIDMDETKNYLIAFNPFLVNQWVVHKSKKPDEGGIYWNYARDPKGNFYISFQQEWSQVDAQDSDELFKLFIAERAYSKINMKVSMIDREKGIFDINGVKYQVVNINGSDWKVKKMVDSKSFGQNLFNLSSDAGSWAF